MIEIPITLAKFTKLLTVICALQVIFPSCKDHFETNFGFNTAYTESSNGLTIMSVDQNADYLYLGGTVTAKNGELEIILTDGNGDVRFQQLIQSSDSTVIINEKFPVCSGYWKLKYKSYKAQGTIDLHMKL